MSALPPTVPGSFLPSSAIQAIGTGSSLPVAGLPIGAQALEPQSIRDGGKAAQSAYQEGLAFEDMLVNELAQQLTDSVPGLSGGSGGGSGGGQLGSGSALGAYASLLPQALSQGIMSTGGTGIAMQIARAIDPALTHPAASGSPSAGSPSAGSAGSPSAGSATASPPSASGGATR